MKKFEYMCKTYLHTRYEDCNKFKDNLNNIVTILLVIGKFDIKSVYKHLTTFFQEIKE